MVANEYNVNELLEPQPFKRENFTAHLYAPFSIKLHRRVYLYGHDNYDVWVMLESDPTISTYNERVVKLPMVVDAIKAVNWSPPFISVNRDGSITLHTVIKDDLPDSESEPKSKLATWTAFCLANGYKYQNWTNDTLNSHKLKIANFKKLLRYTSMAGVVGDYALENQILSEINAVRKIIFSKIINQFPLSDSEEVKASIARLILSNKVFSDLHLFPFSMLTEVSAYHEFSKDQK
jgi:hypothetical protein